MAIEQDLAWVCLPPQSCRSVIAHEEPYTGDEPTLRDYFFERIRPVVERALASANRREWPLIVLNLDFKTNEPEHHAAVWTLLGEYEAWLTTAARTARSDEIARLDVRPVLVLTGEPDAQQAAFHDRVPVGGRLRVIRRGRDVTSGRDARQCRCASGRCLARPPHELSPLVEQPVVCRRNGRATAGGRVDGRGRGAAAPARDACARRWPVDSFLYTQRHSPGRALAWLGIPGTTSGRGRLWSSGGAPRSMRASTSSRRIGTEAFAAMRNTGAAR